ncbi:hypothetical protein HYFRA_00008994 [Hymenoscyphus fraxineus]|uniref:Myb-like domain-containing protein n=1 Tax=Hymenoscyphus fraxineus TaxID=746836 RepID=A0A9N9KRE9_9HELO|nr:hypothetical protein HYFRA_00008994 [Hymenoscyphus fraxineus]
MASQVPAKWTAEEVEVLNLLVGIVFNDDYLRPTAWCGVAEGVTNEMMGRYPNQEHRLYTPFSCQLKYDKLMQGIDDDEDEDDDTVVARPQTPYQHHHNQPRAVLGDVQPDDPRYIPLGAHPDLHETHGDEQLGAFPASQGLWGAQSPDAGGEEGMMGGGMMAPPSVYGTSPEGFATSYMNADGREVHGGGGSDGNGDFVLGGEMGEGEGDIGDLERWFLEPVTPGPITEEMIDELFNH